MAFKKVLTSDGQPVVIGSTDADKIKYPPGFSYRIGGTVYTVKEDVTQEVNSPMREVIVSDGTTEIIPVESISKDLKESDCEVLDMDQRYSKVAPVKKVSKKKVVKKKTAKKKVKKKTKNG